MKQVKKILISLVLLFLCGETLFAAETTAFQSDSLALFTNTLFIFLSLLILVFLVIIFSLGSAIKKFADYRLTEIKEKNKSGATTILSVAGLLLISSSSFGQEPVKIIEDASIMGLSATIAYSLFCILATEIFITIFLLYIFKRLLKREASAEEFSAQPEVSFLDKFNASIAIEKEEDIMFHHEYDGIRELDNNLPPWWKYGFYLTIVFAFIYIGYYHFSGGAKLQVDEYNQQLAEAKEQLAEFRKKSAGSIDENNVTLLTEKEVLSKGKEDYIMNCSACHGQSGEGTVGPNLTDDYWLHGGSIKDVFKTIKFGYAEKGMKSWENDLSPLQIQQIASYIKSLRGTNPPNAKEKQGDLYSEGAAQSDSTQAVNDSTATKADSTNAAVATVK